MQEPYSHGSPQTRSMAFHPYNIYLMLTLAGIVVLFIALSASFIYSRVEGNIPVIKLPPIFLFNTLILLGSSATLIWAKRCYLSDHTENYQKALIYTIVLTLIFMIAQFIGWQQLFASNFHQHQQRSGLPLPHLWSALCPRHRRIALSHPLFVDGPQADERTGQCTGVFLGSREKTQTASADHLLAFSGYPLDLPRALPLDLLHDHLNHLFDRSIGEVRVECYLCSFPNL